MGLSLLDYSLTCNSQKTDACLFINCHCLDGGLPPILFDENFLFLLVEAVLLVIFLLAPVLVPNFEGVKTGKISDTGIILASVLKTGTVLVHMCNVFVSMGVYTVCLYFCCNVFQH